MNTPEDAFFPEADAERNKGIEVLVCTIGAVRTPDVAEGKTAGCR
jgi:hypothetical protein